MSTGTSKVVNLYAKSAVSLQFKGTAEPSTDPGSPVNPEYWIASGPGTYTNFDGLEVTGDVAFLVFDGQSWSITEFSIGDNNHTTFSDISTDSHFDDAIPAGKVLQMVVIENKTENVAQLSMGTMDGGRDIFGSEAIEGNKSSVVFIKPFFNREDPTGVYIHDGGDGDDWNEASLQITLLFVKI